MKVLHLPNNIASLPSTTSLALNKVGGIESTVYSNVTHHYLENEGVICKVIPSFGSSPIKNIYGRFWQFFTLLKLIYQADILHWYSLMLKPSFFWVWYIRLLKKPGVIEWVGSDIRNPNYLKQVNPYYYKEVQNGRYEYKGESYEEAQRQQKYFKILNFKPVAAPELNMYIDKSIFNEVAILYQRLNLDKYIPRYPDPLNKRPIIVHMPSATGAKGTIYVEQTIDQLKKTCDFEYIRVHNVKRSEALEIISKADIVLDQFIGGGYGMAACEAMAFGKPVFCYLLDELFQYGLVNECPIINTNPDTLYEVLKNWLHDGQKRYETGLKSREFVERHHDQNTLCLKLIDIYKSQINNLK